MEFFIVVTPYGYESYGVDFVTPASGQARGDSGASYRPEAPIFLAIVVIAGRAGPRSE